MTSKPTNKYGDPAATEKDWLATVGALLQIGSVAALVATSGWTAYQYRGRSEEPTVSDLIAVLLSLTFLSAALLILLTILGYFYSKRARTVRDKTVVIQLLESEKSSLVSNSSLICSYFHAIANEQSQLCSYLYRSAPSRSQIESALQGYLDAVLINASLIFGLYTKAPCAACLKLFTDSDGELSAESLRGKPMQYVRTQRRDAASRVNRQSTDNSPECKTYRYQKNSAFAHIVDNLTTPDFFSCDDLLSLGKDYKNENRLWSSFYNAVIVVPVKPPGKPAHEVCTGFLCVDNMSGGLSTDEAKYMMEEIAVMIYLALEMSAISLERTPNGS